MGLFKSRKLRFPLLIFLLSILPLWLFLHSGLPITHDGIDHVARIANFYQSLSEGNLIPRWAGNLNWGYGHPILMFLYPLPSYIASIFHFLGFSLIDSIKLVFAASYVLSGLTMFLWVKNFLGEKEGLVASVLYLFAPYRFVDMYVRGAIGEHVAFIFPPLILYFLYKLSENRNEILDKKTFLLTLGGALSLGGFILSHNAISLIFAPFILFYALFLVWQNKKYKNPATSFITMFALGGAVSAFFWFPAFFEGKYTLRDIVTAGTYASSFVNPVSLIYSPWNFGGTGQFSVQIGLLNILAVLSLPLVLKKLKERRLLIFYVFAFSYFLISVFFMLAISNPLYNILTTLQKLQFPWRFLSVSIFMASIMGAFLVYSIPKKQKVFAAGLIIIASITLSFNYWKVKGYLYRDDSSLRGIYKSTTDTGESAPIWSVRFMEKESKDTIEIIEGEAVIKKLARNSAKHSYEIDVITDNARIKENTLYFPGWKIFADGTSLNLQFQDPNHRGLMTFNLSKGHHKVYAVFEETKLRLFADYVTIVSIITVISWGSLILIKGKLTKKA